MIDTALIGYGRWGRIVGEHLKYSRYYNLKYICNSKSDLELVWRDPEIKAVVITTPNRTRYDLIMTALFRGKHVLVEKPLAMSVEQCEELIKVSSDFGLVLLTDYIYTFSPAVRKMAELIIKDKVGAIRYIDMNLKRTNDIGAPDGMYWHLCTHMLSVLNMIMPIKDMEFKMDKEGMIFNGGVIRVGLHAPERITSVMVYGEKGIVEYNHERSKNVVLKVINHRQYQNIGYEIDDSHNLDYVLLHFWKAINKKADDNTGIATEITRKVEQCLKSA